MERTASYREVFAETGLRPASQVVVEARVVAGRMASMAPGAMAKAAAAALAFGGAAVVAGGTLVFDRLRGASDPLMQALEPDWRVRLGLAIAAGGAAMAALVFGALLVRIASRVKADGRVGRAWSLRREIDTVVGNLGAWQSAVALFFLLPAAGIVVAGVSVPCWLAAQAGLLPAWACAAAAVPLSLALAWVLLVLPFQWAPALMAEHDCGWIRAMEASTRMLALAPRWNAAVGALAALSAATVAGLPFAAALLACGRDAYGPIVPLLLKHRTVKDTRALLRRREEDAAQPKGVRRGHRLLEAGRYLDAANSFQTVLFDHREHPAALRGVCLAYLHLGNLTQAQERLDRWQRAEPDNPEPAALMRELAAGAWSEGGEKWAQARARCTQEIGKGLTNEEALSDKALASLRRAPQSEPPEASS